MKANIRTLDVNQQQRSYSYDGDLMTDAGNPLISLLYDTFDNRVYKYPSANKRFGTGDFVFQ